MLLAAILVEPAAAADEMAVQLRYMELKGNGRLDPGLLALCDPKQSLANAVASYKDKHRVTAVTVLDIRIDKVVRLATGTTGVRWGGIEFGITATSVADSTIQTQLLCRKSVAGVSVKTAHCPAIDSCSREFSKNLVDWLKVVKPR